MNTIQSILYKSFQDNADRNALIDADGSTITYEELFTGVSKVAGYLKERGLKTGDFVVIALSKSVPYIFVELACFLYGYGAVLMDESYPMERIEYAMKDSGGKLIIDARMFKDMLSTGRACDYHEVPGDTPAVIIYTSGSTGKPKGILHDQESIYNSITRRQTILKPSKDDIAGLVPPFTFIAGCITTLNALTAGACATVVPRQTIINPKELSRFINQRKISWIYMSPKILKVFEEEGATLRMVVTGSERVSGIAPRRYTIYNTYGMSETASAVAGFLLDKAYDNTPLGKPLGGYAIYTLDDNCNKAAEGEICIAGHLLTEYIGMPEKTAQAIIPNPFVGEDGHEKLFRTGDLGRFDSDGNLVFVNRKDWMVKINGQRVEPGEIEAVIKEVPGVFDAAVKGFTRDNDQTYLCAFYVKNGEVDEDTIKLAISRKLPSYMMPAYFVLLEKMPVNPNGKLNRLALEAPTQEELAAEFVAPTNQMEERLCNVMAEVLGVSRVGINDDFFTIGGDSITCMNLIARMDEPALSARLIYAGRTPAEIAKAITNSYLMYEQKDMDEANRLALMQDQPLLNYQLYYLDYQLYSPKYLICNLPFEVSVSKDIFTVQKMKEAVNKLIHHFAFFGSVFMFNDANELVQRYCPDRIPEIEIEEKDEEEYQKEKSEFIQPFKLLNVPLWHGKIVATGSHIHLLLDFNHAVSDGMMCRKALYQLFEVVEGRELQKDYYYLFLQREAQHALSHQAEIDREFLHKMYDEGWSKFPKTDFDSRDNGNASNIAVTTKNAESYKKSASQNGISLGTAFVTAALMALSRFNNEKRVALEWLFNGRDEKWKEDLIGITLCGVPAALDFEKCDTREKIIAEARHQNELGMQYAQYSYAAHNMSPTVNECMKVVYEHGLDDPDNIPDGFTLEADRSFFNGMLALFQYVIYEKGPDEGITVLSVGQGTRYKQETIDKLGELFCECLDELLGLCD